VALEGALKMKEITYKHAEGFPGGELKHGPLALVTDRTPVVAIVSGKSNAEKMIGNVKEVEAREAPVITVTDSSDTAENYADHLSYEFPILRASLHRFWRTYSYNYWRIGLRINQVAQSTSPETLQRA